MTNQRVRYVLLVCVVLALILWLSRDLTLFGQEQGGPVPAEGYELHVYQGTYSGENPSAFATAEIPLAGVTCQVTTTPTVPPPLVINPTRVLWGGVDGLPDCAVEMAAFLKGLPVTTGYYSTRVRAWGTDPAAPGVRLWGELGGSSNIFYQPPPTFTATCPQPITVSTPLDSIQVSWAPIVTSGGVTPVYSVYAPSVGSNFAAGQTTTVVGSATDAIMRTANCQFTITVNKTTPPPEPEPPPIDSESPTASLTAKQNGNSPNFTVTANVADNVGVVRVEWLLDGVLRAFATEAPFVATVRIPSGSHTLGIRAYDRAGNVGVAGQTINRK